MSEQFEVGDKVLLLSGFDDYINRNSEITRHYEGLEGVIKWNDVNMGTNGEAYIFVHFTAREGYAQYWPVPVRFVRKVENTDNANEAQ